MNKRMLALLAALVASIIYLSVAPVIAAVDGSGTAEGSVAPIASTTVEANYRIAEEDVLRMDVWGEPQLSQMQMQVTPGGKVNVPFLGEMQVLGLTLTEVSDQIAKKLAELEIIYEAKVQITLLSLHRPQVRILGAVQRSGSFEFKEGDTILDAIAQGGSYSDDAMLESATLTHQGESTQIPIDLKKLLAGDLTQNEKLKNGDAIYIPHEDYNNKVFVMGQVNRPGAYPLKDNMTLTTAISLAGSQTERGNIRRSVIVRGDRTGKSERVQCNLNQLFDKGDLSQDVVLKAGDIIVVPESKKIDWNKISQIIGTIVNVGYIRRMGLF